MALDKLLDEKEFAFTVDGAKMIEKLRKFQSTDPLMYVSELVRIAAGTNPKSIRINSRKKYFSIEHDGIGMSEEELNRLLTEVFSPEDKEEAKKELEVGDKVKWDRYDGIIKELSGEVAIVDFSGTTETIEKKDLSPIKGKTLSKDPYRRLGTSIISAFSAEPERIEIETTKDGKNITAIIDDSTKEIAFYEGFRKKGTKISIVRKKSRAQSRQEIKKILQDCRYSSIPTYLGRKRINKEISIPNPIYSISFESDKGIRGAVGLQRRSKKEEHEININHSYVTFLKNGVEISTKREDGLKGRGLTAVVDSDDFNIVVSGNEIVQDNAYSRALEAINEASESLAVDLISKMGRFNSYKDNERIRKYLLQYLDMDIQRGGISSNEGDLRKIMDEPIARRLLFQTVEGEKVSLFGMYIARNNSKLYRNKKPCKIERVDKEQGLMVMLAEDEGLTEGIVSKLFPLTTYYDELVGLRKKREEEELRKLRTEKRLRKEEVRSARRQKIDAFFDSVNKYLDGYLSPVTNSGKAVTSLAGRGIKKGANFAWDLSWVMIHAGGRLMDRIDEYITSTVPSAEEIERRLEKRRAPSLERIFAPERKIKVKGAFSYAGRSTLNGIKTAGYAVWLPFKYAGLGVAAGSVALVGGIYAGAEYVGEGIAKGASYVGSAFKKDENKEEIADVGLGYGRITESKRKKPGLWSMMLQEFRERRNERARRIQSEKDTEKYQRGLLEKQFEETISEFFRRYIDKKTFVLSNEFDDEKRMLMPQQNDIVYLNGKNPHITESIEEFKKNKGSIDYFLPVLFSDTELLEGIIGKRTYGDSWRFRNERVIGIRSVIDSAYSRAHPFGIYHDDNAAFERIFPMLTEKEQKDVLGYIFTLNKEQRNERADKWLTENYKAIIEEAGMQMVGTDGKKKDLDTLTKGRVMYIPDREGKSWNSLPSLVQDYIEDREDGYNQIKEYNTKEHYEKYEN